MGRVVCGEPTEFMLRLTGDVGAHLGPKSQGVASSVTKRSVALPKPRLKPRGCGVR